MFLQQYRTKYARFFVTLMIILGLGSCAKEEFMAQKSQDSFSTPLTFTNNANVCSQFTLIKPRVDFLFLWDNTSSQVFVTNETKQALSNTINYISDRFDFHILMAPLVPQPGSAINDVAYLITASTFGLGQSAINIRVEKSEAANVLNNFTTSSSGNEKGLKRSYDMLSANISNGIFRQDAYTIIVVMSNGNDYVADSNGFASGPLTNEYIQTYKNLFLNLRNSIIHSTQMRFASLVAHTSGCHPFWVQGGTYTTMSKYLYEADFPSGDLRKLPYDQTGDSTPDSYNICTTVFVHLFDGINNSIQDTVIAHQYNFWPISAVQSPITFDPNKLRVQKANGDEFFEVSGPNQGDGWRYAGYLTNQNMRYAPSPGEAFTGHMIELYGNARVTYPECLLVTTVSPTYYYGYVALSSKPIESSIRVTIDGRSIPQSNVDGWEYIGAKASQNLRIQGLNFPQDPYQEALPADIRTNSHFLKMHGEAIYQSGAVVNVVYDPSGD